MPLTLQMGYQSLIVGCTSNFLGDWDEDSYSWNRWRFYLTQYLLLLPVYENQHGLL